MGIAKIDGKSGMVLEFKTTITIVGIKPNVADLVRELRSTLTKVPLDEFAGVHLCEVSCILNNKQIEVLLNEAMELAKTKGEKV